MTAFFFEREFCNNPFVESLLSNAELSKLDAWTEIRGIIKGHLDENWCYASPISYTKLESKSIQFFVKHNILAPVDKNKQAYRLGENVSYKAIYQKTQDLLNENSSQSSKQILRDADKLDKHFYSFCHEHERKELSLEEYLALSDEYCAFNADNRKVIYSIYERYRKWLDENHYYDDNDLARAYGKSYGEIEALLKELQTQAEVNEDRIEVVLTQIEKNISVQKVINRTMEKTVESFLQASSRVTTILESAKSAIQSANKDSQVMIGEAKNIVTSLEKHNQAINDMGSSLKRVEKELSAHPNLGDIASKIQRSLAAMGDVQELELVASNMEKQHEQTETATERMQAALKNEIKEGYENLTKALEEHYNQVRRDNEHLSLEIRELKELLPKNSREETIKEDGGQTTNNPISTIRNLFDNNRTGKPLKVKRVLGKLWSENYYFLVDKIDGDRAIGQTFDGTTYKERWYPANTEEYIVHLD